jgi:hypothetical protein
MRMPRAALGEAAGALIGGGYRGAAGRAGESASANLNAKLPPELPPDSAVRGNIERHGKNWACAKTSTKRAETARGGTGQSGKLA